MRWIHNAIGIVNGTNEDEVVIVGNHHDSWMIGGAGKQRGDWYIDKITYMYSGSAFRLSNSDRAIKSNRYSTKDWMEAKANDCALQLGC